MNKFERELFGKLREAVDDSISLRCQAPDGCLEEVVELLLSDYLSDKKRIDYYIALKGIDAIISDSTEITSIDNPELFDGSWEYDNIFKGHYFGSVRKLFTRDDYRNSEEYTIDKLVDIIGGRVNDARIGKLIAGVLVDSWGNGLFGVDVRINTLERRIINDIQHIINYLIIDDAELHRMIEFLTFNNLNIIDSINYKRYHQKTKHLTNNKLSTETKNDVVDNIETTDDYDYSIDDSDIVSFSDALGSGLFDDDDLF